MFQRRHEALCSHLLLSVQLPMLVCHSPLLQVSALLSYRM